MANAARIKKLMGEGKRLRGTSVLLYGAPKSGKTAQAATLAAHYKLLWLDIENGAATLFNEKIVDPELLENIELYSVPDYKGKPLGIEYTMKLFKGETLMLCDDHSVHNCPQCKLHNAKHPNDKVEINRVNIHELDLNEWIVVVDSITQLTRSAAAYITNKQLNGDDAKFEFDHWRLQNVYVDTVMDMVQSGLFNTVCITHEQGIEQVDGTEKITPSGSTKNYARTIAKNFDSVIRCKLVGTKHVISTQTTEEPKAVTGTRENVNVQRDGLAALFNPALRTADPVKTEKAVGKTTTAKSLIRR